MTLFSYFSSPFSICFLHLNPFSRFLFDFLSANVSSFLNSYRFFSFYQGPFKFGSGLLCSFFVILRSLLPCTCLSNELNLLLRLA
jgi:hypothetical protein